MTTPEQRAARFEQEAAGCEKNAAIHRRSAARRKAAGDGTAHDDLMRLAQRCDESAAMYRRHAREARRGRL